MYPQDWDRVLILLLLIINPYLNQTISHCSQGPQCDSTAHKCKSPARLLLLYRVSQKYKDKEILSCAFQGGHTQRDNLFLITSSELRIKALTNGM
jgi:hypothetical protein